MGCAVIGFAEARKLLSRDADRRANKSIRPNAFASGPSAAMGQRSTRDFSAMRQHNEPVRMIHWYRRSSPRSVNPSGSEYATSVVKQILAAIRRQSREVSSAAQRTGENHISRAIQGRLRRASLRRSAQGSREVANRDCNEPANLGDPDNWKLHWTR